MRRDGASPKKKKTPPPKRYAGGAKPLSGTEYVRATPRSRETQRRADRDAVIFGAGSIFTPDKLVVKAPKKKGPPPFVKPTRERREREEELTQEAKRHAAMLAPVNQKARITSRQLETPNEKAIREGTLRPPPGLTDRVLGFRGLRKEDVTGAGRAVGDVSGALAKAVVSGLISRAHAGAGPQSRWTGAPQLGAGARGAAAGAATGVNVLADIAGPGANLTRALAGFDYDPHGAKLDALLTPLFAAGMIGGPVRGARAGAKAVKAAEKAADEAAEVADLRLAQPSLATGDPTLVAPAGSKLYHASYQPGEIAQGGFRPSTQGESGAGVYFAPTPEIASRYPEREVVEATTSRDLRLLDRTTEKGEKIFRDIQGLGFSYTDPKAWVAFQRRLSDAGYDGIKYSSGGDMEIVVHDPSALRTARPILGDTPEDEAVALTRADGLTEETMLRGVDTSVFRGNPDFGAMIARVPEYLRRGIGSRFWYEDSAKEILAMAGGNKVLASRIAQVIAVYSAQRKPGENINLAIEAYRQWAADKVITVGTGPQKRKAKMILEGGDWKGRKTDRFFKNMIEDIDYDAYIRDFKGTGRETTNDIWVARMFGLKTDNPTAREYEQINTALANIADELGWKPKQVQAALWGPIRLDTEIARKAAKGSKATAVLGDVSENFLTALRAESARIPVGPLAAPEEAARYAALNDAGRAAYDTEIQEAVTDFLVESKAFARIGRVETNGRYTVLMPSPGTGTSAKIKLKPEARAQLNAVTATIAEATGRNEASWFRPYYRASHTLKARNGAHVALDRELTPAEMAALEAAFTGRGIKVALPPDVDGFVVLSLNKPGSKKLHADFEEVLNTVLGEATEDAPRTLRWFASESSAPIRRGKNGKFPHTSRSRWARRPVVQRAKDRLESRVADIHGRHLGAGEPRGAVRRGAARVAEAVRPAPPGIVHPSFRGRELPPERTFRVTGGVEHSIPAAGSRPGRFLERAMDAFRDTPVGARTPFLRSEAQKYGAELARTAETHRRLQVAPAEVLRHMGMDRFLVRGRPGKLVLSEGMQYAMRIVAEGAASADRYAFHAAQAKAAGNARNRGYHLTHMELIKAARPYLDEANGVPRLADDAPLVLTEAYRLLEATAVTREDIYRSIGQLQNDAIRDRLQSPGRVIHGARNVPEGDIDILRGAEWFEEGKTYVPYRQGIPSPNIVRRATQGFSRVSFGGGRQRVISRGTDDKALRKQFTGGSQLSGYFRTDVTSVAADSLVKASQVAATKWMRDKLLLSAVDDPAELVRAGKVPRPIRTDESVGKPLPKGLAQVWEQMDAATAGEKLNPKMMEDVSASALDDLKRQLFSPQVPSERVIEGIKWVDADIVHGAGLDVPAARSQLDRSFGPVGKTFDVFNSAVRASILYLAPYYAPINLMQNVMLNFMHQGVFAPANLSRAMRLGRHLTPTQVVMVDALMGKGATKAVLDGMGTHKLAEILGRISDTAPRRAAFLHEARRRKIRPRELGKLLDRAATGDEQALKQADAITRAASDAMFDYDRMNSFERDILKRVVFFYSFLRASTRYTMRFPLEHPYQAAAYSYGYYRLRQRNEEQIGGPYYLSETQLIPEDVPLVGGKAINLKLLNPFGAPFEIIQAAINTVKGDPTMPRFSEMTTPYIEAMASLIGYRSEAFGEDVGVRGAADIIVNYPAPYRYYKAYMDATKGTNAEKLYPRTRADAIAQIFLGSIAPKEINVEKARELAGEKSEEAGPYSGGGGPAPRPGSSGGSGGYAPRPGAGSGGGGYAPRP